MAETAFDGSTDGDLATLNSLNKFVIAGVQYLGGGSDAAGTDVEHLRRIGLANLGTIRQICRML